MRQLLTTLRQLVTRQSLLLYGGYVAFFVFCFVLFAYWTFPYERVRDLLVAEASSPAAPGGAQNKLSIGELGPHWLTGVAMSEVSFEKRTPGNGDDPPGRVQIDELKLHASPISLLLGGLDVSFAAEVGEGEIAGNYAGDEGEPTEVLADLDAVDLERLGVGSYLGVPIAGAATGKIDVTLAKEPAATQGSVELRIAGLRLGDKEKLKVKIPSMGPLTLATMDAGTLELKVAVRDGVATIESMEAKGKDVELSGSGSIRVATPLSQSRADITLAVRIADAYKQRTEKTKATFELLSMNPMVTRATSPDGTMRFKLTGTVSNLRSAPAGPARSPGKAREKSRTKPSAAEEE